MPATEFLDANILVYAYDPSDERKQQIARELVRQAVDGLIVTSVQVLAEFSSTLLHKQKSLASANDVRAVLDALAAIPVMAPNAAMVRRAIGGTRGIRDSLLRRHDRCRGGAGPVALASGQKI